MNLVLIDTITGTAMNYDKDVYVVDLDDLNEEQQALLDDWNVTGADHTIIELAQKAGVVVTHTNLPPNGDPEYSCDRCGVHVPDGEGCYLPDSDDRVCEKCRLRATQHPLPSQR